MNLSAFFTVFPRRLRFWAFHCVMNALPSLGIIALFFPELKRSPTAIAAILSAICTFIFLIATLTSLRGPLSIDGHILSRSLKLGAKIRAWMAVVSLLPLAGKENSILYIPDYYCDLLALIAASYATIPGFSMNDLAYGPPTDFIPIYGTTILTGLILSFLLLAISFFAVIFLQARDRKRVFAVAEPLFRDDG